MNLPAIQLSYPPAQKGRVETLEAALIADGFTQPGAEIEVWKHLAAIYEDAIRKHKAALNFPGSDASSVDFKLWEVLKP